MFNKIVVKQRCNRKGNFQITALSDEIDKNVEEMINDLHHFLPQFS